MTLLSVRVYVWRMQHRLGAPHRAAALPSLVPLFVCNHTQEDNFDEAVRAAFHAWTQPSIRKWVMPETQTYGATSMDVPTSGQLINSLACGPGGAG